MDEITVSILDKLSKYWDEPINLGRRTVCLGDLIFGLLTKDSVAALSAHINIPLRTLERYLPTILSNLGIEKKSSLWSISLLELARLRRCIYCKKLLPISHFYNYSGRTSSRPCKACDLKSPRRKTEEYRLKGRLRSKEHYLNNKPEYRARNSIRNRRIRQATPPWANLEEIKNIYRNVPEGYQVDHIIPIKNEFVCGLHVSSNLQYLSAKDNRTKSNIFNVGEQADW